MTSNQPPASAVDPLLGRVLDDRYRIEAFIARGGMATIYRGADLRLDRTVAIKVMHPSFATDPGFVDRFEREARAAARLNSPYAVAVHDQGNDAGITYLVMEYVPGHTVRDVLRTHGALQPAQALAILDPVLEALAAAHRAGYIHRDVKPENVLISDDGRVKVTDFGLARAIEGADSGRTHGLLLGTVAYLSPEQVEHDRTDARSDVYSAGILLFELLTGQVPFSAAAPMQVAYKHVHEDVPVPSSVHPGIPAGIDELAVRATRRTPAQRFPDASAFLADVRRQRAMLPPAQPWAPAPNDTLVVATGPANGAAGAAAAGAGAGVILGAATDGPAESLDAPDWVNEAAPDGSAGSPPVIAGGPPEQIIDQSDEPLDEQPHEEAAAPPTSSGGELELAAGSAVTAVTHQTSPEARGRVRRGRKGLWLGLVALLSIGALLFLVLGPLQQVEVPDVLGAEPADASITLATYNLLLDSEQEAYSEDYPKGQIMATDPAPGESIRTGGTVVATVSKGPERYEVPKLKGLTVPEAEVALSAANLVLGTQATVYDDKVKKDDIVSSSPKAGESVKPGTEVSVKVSKGPEPVELPELEGTDGDEAEAQLSNLGLEVDRSNEFSESVAKGLVISMTPKGGTTAYRGDTVQLVVSKGPPLVEVPNVVGMSESQARAALEGAGFKVQVNKPLGFVVFGVNSQSPKAGAEAPKGSTVTITVV